MAESPQNEDFALREKSFSSWHIFDSQIDDSTVDKHQVDELMRTIPTPSSSVFSPRRCRRPRSIKQTVGPAVTVPISPQSITRLFHCDCSMHSEQISQQFVVDTTCKLTVGLAVKSRVATRVASD